jgi:hypothetical protein
MFSFYNREGKSSVLAHRLRQFETPKGAPAIFQI